MLIPLLISATDILALPKIASSGVFHAADFLLYGLVDPFSRQQETLSSSSCNANGFKI
jgi:hypothetical protein